MKAKLSVIIKAFIICLMFAGAFFAASQIIVPRYVYQNSDYSTTSTVRGFYQLKRNTCDVLILGTSHFVNAMIPQEIYDRKQIRSYNLASEQQSPFLSCYLLKEALKYQSVQAVVMDCNFLTRFNDEEAINMSDELFRKVSDNMRFSLNKIQMINEYTELNGGGEKLSYFLPIIRYHSRWKDLNKVDIEVLTYTKHNELKGFYPLYHEAGVGFTPIDITGDKKEPMDELMREYLERITGICVKENIKLILVNTPENKATVERYNEIKAYADEKGIKYYDLSERSLYERMEISEPKESVTEPDGGEHANLYAAVKISKLIAELLEENGVTGKKDSQWGDTETYYRKIFDDPLFVKQK